ncbi:MAG: DUF4397 domain-containing protein [Chloroflexi bacterium]|nr:DUF4397 domain-containing protein [Chloroflexota bacterium]
MRTIKLLVWVMALAVLAVTAGGTIAQDATASVRFVHVIPAVSGLDVYINGNLSAANLGYGEATGYIDAPTGDLSVRVTLSGVSSTLWEQVVAAAPESAQTLIASAADPLAFDVYEDSLDASGLTTTRFSIVHAVNNGPAVDIVAEGQTIATALAYGGFLNTIDAPANTYTFTVVPEGGSVDAPVFPATAFGLAGRTSHMLVLYGPATAPTAMLLKAPVRASGDGGFVRVTHGAEGAPNVDVLVNGELVVPGLAFGESTVHIPVEAGSYETTLRVAGGGSEITTATVDVTSGSAQTLAAIGTLDDLRVESFADAVSGVTARSAVASVINGISGATITLTSSDGLALATDLGFGTASSAVSFEPSRQSLTLTINAGEIASTVEVPATSFYGGTYYNLVAVRDGGNFSVDVNATSLALAINSAPGGSAELASLEPTAAPTTVEVAAQPTTVPEGQPTQQVVIANAPTAPTLPTARVVLDPGANLQLREYPRSDARSLGLAPNGTVFSVNGRVGAPIDILTGDVIKLPDGTDFVDPVSLLPDEKTDLEPAATWINVTLATADGEVTAWINTLYVDLRTPRGEQQRLRDLPTVPQNQPGSSQGTIVATPAPPENFARAIVFNLDPGVGLNIRRTPETTGEVLGRVLSGGSMELVGFGASGDWAFVEYLPAEGGSVRGWAGTLYLQYAFRGRPVDLEEMTALGLLEAVDEATLRGSVTAGAPPLIQPTVNPLRNVNVALVVGLDAGVNLNLRRTPDTNAEVLLQVPMGASMRVLSRSGSEAWLEVEFDGTTGWVASLYTVLTFNDRPVKLVDIPVNATFSATATPTPTPAPTATPGA